ncbi:MAG TPA: flagellar motor switch protein FliN [Gammaproteobacteria bacterium]|nr:flagellar motor switch protein FliN [Gammaproteobacteria bacterium]
MNDQTTTEDDWGAALAEQAAAGGGTDETAAEADDQADVERASFQDLHDEGGENLGDGNLDMILDIPVNVAVEIGRSKITISNLLKLNQGSVVELDRLAGEPMDVLVNGTLIAHGEVVVVNEKFGIRLTDIISPTERVKKLK